MGKPTDESVKPRFPYPIGFGDLIGLTFRTFARHFLTLTALFCIPFLVIALLPLALHVDFSGTAFITAYLVALVVLPVVIGSIAAGIASVIVVDRFAGLRTTVGGALAKLRGRLDQVVISGGIGTFLAIVLAVFLNGAYMLILLALFIGPPILVQIITIESTNVREGLRRMKELWAGQRLRVFMYLFNIALTTGLVAIMIFLSVAQALTTSTDFEALDSSTYLVEATRGVVFGLCAAIVACAATIMYLGLRAEKDGLDHDELAELRAA